MLKEQGTRPIKENKLDENSRKFVKWGGGGGWGEGCGGWGLLAQGFIGIHT